MNPFRLKDTLPASLGGDDGTDDSVGQADGTVTRRRGDAREPSRRSRDSRAAGIAGVAATVLVAVALALFLSQSDARLAGTNSVSNDGTVAQVDAGERLCQDGESVPPGTAAVEIVTTSTGGTVPPVAATVAISGGPSLSGRHTGGSGAADVPIRLDGGPTEGGRAQLARVCVSNRGTTPLLLGGAAFAPPAAAVVRGADGREETAGGRIVVRYRRPGRESWWSLASDVARRSTVAKADLGAWTPAALFALVWAGALGLLLRSAKRPRPRFHAPRGAACAVLVTLNAVVWALVIPPFHVPDEPQHAAYVQYLAETEELPRHTPGNVFSDEESTAFSAVNFNAVIGDRVNGRPPWTPELDAAIDDTLAQPLARDTGGAVSNTTNNPPLYYLGAAVPYEATSTGNFFDRLLAMRLWSALLGGVTALFVFLFLRQCLPAVPLAGVAGALVAGLLPTFAFITAGVNNDAGLFAASAATLWALARTFRRGLGPGTGALVGACFGLGLITKVTIAGFVPGLLLAAALLLRRQWHARRRAAISGVAVAVAAAAVPVVLYVVAINTVWDRPLWSGGVALSGSPGAPTGHAASLGEFASYLWQFYLPRLPFMQYDIGPYPLWEVWFKGFVGRFGWLDYGFPAAAYKAALAVFLVGAALAARGLWLARTSLRRRFGEAAVYAVLVAGLLFVIGVQGYRYRVDTGLGFEQARYLLPVLGLFGAGVALAVRGAGRRWAPTVAALVVVGALAHGLAALLLTVGRYYA